MKAVIYARYSSDNQREESIEGQLRECTAYCKKNDITILRTYIDRAMSAKTDHRPDFQRMIKDYFRFFSRRAIKFKSIFRPRTVVKPLSTRYCMTSFMVAPSAYRVKLSSTTGAVCGSI